MYDISIPSFSCLFWFIILIVKWKNNDRSQNIFAINLLSMAISFYIWGTYIQGLDNYKVYYLFDIADAFVTLCIFPFTYLFFKSFTDERPLKWFHYFIFLPSLLIGIGTAVLYVLMGNEQAINFIRALIIHNEQMMPEFNTSLYKVHYLISIKAYNGLLILQIVFVIVYAIISLVNFHKRLKDFFSNPEEKSMKHNKAILICFILSLLFSLVTCLSGRSLLIEYYQTFLIPLSALWGAVLNYLGFQIATLNYTADKLAADLRLTDEEAIEKGYKDDFSDNNRDKNTNEEIKRKTNPELIDKFNRLINEERIFTQKDLRIDDVARKMQTNRTYISRMLNEEFHSGFSDFINAKRVEYAKKLIMSNSGMSQEEIAILSGFSHPSSFSRTFRQHTGTTFREWQKNAK